MKPFIAIFSCIPDARNGRNQAIRETWAARIPDFDYRFFVGIGDIKLQPDEIQVYAYDDGDNLCHKEAAMMKWAVNQGYERILKTETDVYLNPNKMIEHGEFLKYDYYGSMVGYLGQAYENTNLYGFIQGHAVWYSRKAAEFVANELIDTVNRLMPTATGSAINHTWRSADMWSGQVLIPKYINGEITAENGLPDYGFGPLSWHCPGDRKGDVPGWLKEMHLRYRQ